MASIGLIGLGHIGGALAQALLSWDVDLYIYDIVQDPTAGKILDLSQARPLLAPGVSRGVYGVAHPSDLAHCDIIVITAGRARASKNPDGAVDRYALLEPNGQVISALARSLQGTKAIVIVVTNPVDVMTWHFWKNSDIDPKRVVGMAGALDSVRFRVALANAMNAPISEVSGYVLGAHSDDMIPVRSSVAVRGKAVTSHELDEVQWHKVSQETQKGGGTIASLLGYGSAFFAPCGALISMIRAFFFDERCVIPTCVWLGEGIDIIESNGSCAAETVSPDVKNLGIFCGTLACLDRSGVRHIYAPVFTKEEAELWNRGTEKVKQLMGRLSGSSM